MKLCARGFLLYWQFVFARGLYDVLSVREECLLLGAGWVIFFFGIFELVFNRHLRLV